MDSIGPAIGILSLIIVACIWVGVYVAHREPRCRQGGCGHCEACIRIIFRPIVESGGLDWER